MTSANTSELAAANSRKRKKLGQTRQDRKNIEDVDTDHPDYLTDCLRLKADLFQNSSILF